ncbi:sensor histidine kinase [Alkalibacter saccharofermentans]|uniref:histidine kinase n=1 Tax=Alkalibacter saccharofermentans DSM 14828 TaxID=1120975 RepID=A0A1M4XNL1_9FIRM|nr:HAMP domain-containing sensor histidine kinase [Alkalibacter saccharofermentans]SHE94853.1 Signal transduction histidine kinase [Alkalibacter saccharofermentans DSM 14828]
MKKSIFNRIFIYMAILILIISGFIVFMVEFFLDDFYYMTQENSLRETAEEIQELYDENNADIEDILKTYSLSLGMTVEIVTDRGTVLYSGSVSGGSGNMRHMMNMMMGQGRFYRMNANDSSVEQDWLIFNQELSDGNYLVIRTGYESFQRAIEALKSFMMYLILPVLILSIAVIYPLSKGISKPLVELNKVAQRMKKLDFKAKYSVRSQDETGQLGQTLNELMVKLEDTIRQLTEELEKEKNLDKMRREFVARVSHEIQTPLTVIEGYIEAIEDKVYANEKDRDNALRVISLEADKISKMTQDLLDLSQLESGSYKLVKRKFNYSDLVRQVHEKYSNQKRDSNVEFRLVADEGCEYHIDGDEFRLEQVLNNLLNNAFNHVRQGGRVILSVEHNGGIITTGVFNEGEKINENELDYIWESFFKGDKRKGKKGVGLGLSIAKNIISLHDGKYKAENRNDGVCFSFDLHESK